MIWFEFKYNGKDENILLSNPDSIQRIREYYMHANKFYLLDELILNLLENGNQYLSIFNPCCSLEELAKLNKLESVCLFVNYSEFRKIV